MTIAAKVLNEADYILKDGSKFLGMLIHCIDQHV